MKTLKDQANEAGMNAVWDKLAEVLNSNDEVCDIYNEAREKFIASQKPRDNYFFVNCRREIETPL